MTTKKEIKGGLEINFYLPSVCALKSLKRRIFYYEEKDN